MGRRSKRIKPIDLANAIKEVLEEYGEEVYAVLPAAVDEVTKEALQKLRSVSRFAPKGHPTGAYSRAWDIQQVYVSRLQDKAVIYNTDHYMLTHLLENGHAKRGGGRVPAYEHIRPVEQWANAELPKLVERKLNEI